MPTVEEALAGGQVRLSPAADSARTDAEILIAQVLDCTRASVAGRARQQLTPEQAADFERLIERRAEGRPVAYLTGHKEFWSLRLAVNPDVLIPRPETELLVEWSLQLLERRGAHPHVADLGTGSGAIAIALAQELPQARLVAVDASLRALEVAQTNAKAQELKNIEFMHASFDLFLRHGDVYDLLVGNPPYVAEGDPHLAALRHEPRHALVSGAQGLDALRQIIEAARPRLRAGGALLLEHGAAQGQAVRDLMRQAAFQNVETRCDLAGLERATAGFRHD